MNEELVLEALTADDTFAPRSLDAPAGMDDGDDWTLADSIGEIDPRMNLTVDCMALRPLVEVLPARDRAILRMRFYEDMTQSQIGAELGVSQMHVSRLLAQMLAVLRTQMTQD